MKKLLFVLLVLVAFGMLAAVESDPSETVGYVKYPCLAGLDLVAMPMDDGMLWTSQVGDALNNPTYYIDTINLWDASTQSYLASVDLGGFWDPDYAVGPGTILFISSSGAFDYYSIGDMPATNAQYAFIPGLNMAMVPLNYSSLTWTSEVGLAIGEVDTVNLWDAATQSYLASVDLGGFYDPDYPVTIGTPMFISYYGTGTTWPAGPRGETRSVAPIRK